MIAASAQISSNAAFAEIETQRALVESVALLRAVLQKLKTADRVRRKSPAAKIMSNAASPFWDFSLHFYARPGVAAACLLLQEEAGADINVVLYLFFLARHNRQVSRQDIVALDNTVADWREQVVRPLRTARRHLKSLATPFAGEAAVRLREEIKRNELAAERIQQLGIEQLFPCASFGAAAASMATAARANLAAYAHRIGTLPPGATDTLIELFNQA